MTRSLTFALALVVSSTVMLPGRQGGLSPAEAQRRVDLELQSIAVVERKVMMPMRDGVRLATDIYRPKDATGPVPVVFVEDAVQLQLLGRPQRRAGRHVAPRSTAVKRGYAYVVQNERGHFFSEGTTTSSARPSPTATTPSSG
jgi:predicted acyl esterase